MNEKFAWSQSKQKIYLVTDLRCYFCVRVCECMCTFFVFWQRLQNIGQNMFKSSYTPAHEIDLAREYWYVYWIECLLIMIYAHFIAMMMIHIHWVFLFLFSLFSQFFLFSYNKQIVDSKMIITPACSSNALALMRNMINKLVKFRGKQNKILPNNKTKQNQNQKQERQREKNEIIK